MQSLFTNLPSEQLGGVCLALNWHALERRKFGAAKGAVRLLYILETKKNVIL